MGLCCYELRKGEANKRHVKSHTEHLNQQVLYMTAYLTVHPQCSIEQFRQSLISLVRKKHAKI